MVKDRKGKETKVRKGPGREIFQPIPIFRLASCLLSVFISNVLLKKLLAEMLLGLLLREILLLRVFQDQIINNVSLRLEYRTN